jgi:hypothetical protein
MDYATTSALARVAAGAAAWVGTSLGVNDAFGEPRPQSPLLVRLVGTRDIALGLLTLSAGPGQKRGLVKAGLLVDAADGVATAIAIRTGAVKPRPGALLLGGSIGAVLAGVRALVQLRKR